MLCEVKLHQSQQMCMSWSGVCWIYRYLNSPKICYIYNNNFKQVHDLNQWGRPDLIKNGSLWSHVASKLKPYFDFRECLILYWAHAWSSMLIFTVWNTYWE